MLTDPNLCYLAGANITNNFARIMNNVAPVPLSHPPTPPPFFFFFFCLKKIVGIIIEDFEGHWI